ncbi:MAG TPA: TRAP transporter substrate-binding protein [Devosiaceae bacterium]|jgi:TRAP-type C4-dicarboxylate transport system substrate-binding protein|nr:TRAP transporter substrate-binding protein [Devosiaceae bacterium]
MNATICLVAAMATVAVAGSSALAQEPVTIKFASAFAPASINNQETIPAFIKAVEEAAGGTIKIEHYPGGTLGPNPTAQLKLVEDGVVDIAEVVAAYTPGRFPELEVFELPFVFDSTLEASLTALEMYEAGLLSGFDDLELVGIAEVGPYYLHTSDPVRSPADISGLKLRVGGPVQGATAEALGAVAVGGIPAPQIAENISRGVVDGSPMDLGNVYNFRIADTAKYHVINVPLGNVAVLFPMNKAKYDSLPPEAKAAFDQFSGEWFTRVLAENLDKQNEQSLAALREDGEHELVEFSEADVVAMEATLAPLAEPFRTARDGVDLYEEMIAARDAVRAAE